MMRVRGGMGAGASALSVESPDAGMKAAYEGESAQQLKQRLSIAETERDREKHKLQRTVDAAQLKRKEWETEKRALKRQLENQEAEVRKRDKWLEKAKDIIKEYQKRHAPGQGPAMS
jgi:chromosome segregation ATPase